MSAEMKSPQEEVHWDSLSTNQWQAQIAEFEQSPIQVEERMYWMVGLREWLVPQVNQLLGEETRATWEELEPLYQMTLQLCPLLDDICDWPLLLFVTDVIGAIESLHTLEPAGDIWTYRTMALCQLGYWQQAIETLTELTEADPANENAANDKATIEKMMSETLYNNPVTWTETLALIPLDHHHLATFSWQYADPQIAERCSLPKFATNEQWQQWLDGIQANPNQHLYAIMDPEWGMVGNLSIEMTGSIGFVYYWIGQDHQSKGYATEALSMAIDMAVEQMGMTCCYAKALTYNTSSIKVLGNCGFKALPFELEKPFDGEQLFYCGPEQSLPDSHEQCKALFHFMNSDIALAPSAEQYGYLPYGMAWTIELDPQVAGFSRV